MTIARRTDLGYLIIACGLALTATDLEALGRGLMVIGFAVMLSGLRKTWQETALPTFGGRLKNPTADELALIAFALQRSADNFRQNVAEARAKIDAGEPMPEGWDAESLELWAGRADTCEALRKSLTG